MLVTSCSHFREIRIEKFYEKWEEENSAINQTQTSEEEADLQRLVDNILCVSKSNYFSFGGDEKRFPKLKYSIVQSKIQVFVVEEVSEQNISEFSSPAYFAHG